MSDSERLGHKCSVRLRALDLAALGKAEIHGKRDDFTAKARRVRDIDPLVYGGLNLRECFERHVEGARRSKKMTKPCGHLLFQFPTGMRLDGERVEQAMMNSAIQFTEKVYGGRAVFAARVDRDEKNRHVVDVFIAPRYVKTTKAGDTDWISVGRWHEALCRKHRDEIVRRMGKFNTYPRAQGMALQSEFIEFLRGKGLDIDDKVEKELPLPDRDEPEVYAAKRIAEANRREAEAEAEVEAATAKKKRIEDVAKGVAEQVVRLAAKAVQVVVGKSLAGLSPATSKRG